MCWLIANIDGEDNKKISSQFILAVLHYQSLKPLIITELRLTLSCSSTFTVPAIIIIIIIIIGTFYAMLFI